MKIVNLTLGDIPVSVYECTHEHEIMNIAKSKPRKTQAFLTTNNLSADEYDLVFTLRTDPKQYFLLLNEQKNAKAIAALTQDKDYSITYVPKTLRNADKLKAADDAALNLAPIQPPVTENNLHPLFESDDEGDELNKSKTDKTNQQLDHENEIANQANKIIDTKQLPENEINDAPANPQDKNVVPNDQQAPAFIPNPYTSIPVAVGIAATGTTVGTAFAYPGFKSLVGHGLSAKIVSGLVLVPAAAALAGGIMTNLALRAQYFLANGTQPTTEALATINETSWLAAGQLGGAFFGVEVARQGIERIIDVVAGDQWFTKLIGEYTSNVAGLGSVELKGAAMVVTGFGLGLGLMAAMIAQDVYHNYHAAREARKVYSPAAYLAAFSIGFAIGAAASIGYSNEVASYLMPLATTTGLLMLLPVVTKPVVHGAWAAEAIKDTYTSTTTLMATKWNQWNVKSNDVTTKDIETQDEYNRKSGVPDTYTL